MHSQEKLPTPSGTLQILLLFGKSKEHQMYRMVSPMFLFPTTHRTILNVYQVLRPPNKACLNFSTEGKRMFIFKSSDRVVMVKMERKSDRSIITLWGHFPQTHRVLVEERSQEDRLCHWRKDIKVEHHVKIQRKGSEMKMGLAAE